MKKEQLAKIIVCLIIFSAVAYGVKITSDATDVVALLNPETGISKRAKALGHQVLLDDYTVRINQVTKQVNARFDLTNKSQHSVFDIVVSCELLDSTGEKRGYGRWFIHETVEPDSSGSYLLEEKRYISHLVNPDMISCRIVDAKTSGFQGGSSDGAGH